mmetsp:Transcript_4889/g.8404  ORF Transcript_4889/g.8404 Transcript_4889/m.8404 type:complete len:873 (-) Transcript_4889:63-2681(-)
MPALVVWEPLLAAGDDLHLLSVIRICLYLAEIALVIPITYYVVTNTHDPSPYVKFGCVRSVDTFHNWKIMAEAMCIFTIIGSVIATVISFAICRVSRRGTPTDTAPRRLLVPLCKCNMVPVLLMKFTVLVLVGIITFSTNKYCSCVQNSLGLDDEVVGRNACPAAREWFEMVRVFLFMLAFDVFVPIVLFFCILKSRASRRLFRNVRPQREKAAEDDYRWWQRCCQTCCECSSLMTCYMFGGQRITAARYVDVAIALTAFFEDRGALDIVPSDVAAALVCLMTIQRQKQIDCRNELLKEGGGIYAKDKKFFGKLWSTMKVSKVNSRRQQQKLLSMDIESGISKQNDEPKVSGSKQQHFEEAVDKQSLSDCEQRDEVESNDLLQTHTSSSNNLTDEELADVLAMLNSSDNEILSNVRFNEERQDGEMTFRPTVRRKLDAENSFDRQVLSEGARYCRVALAAYSWMMYLWTSRCIGCCELSAITLCELCMCRPRYCRSRDHIKGDNLCAWKQTSVLKTLGIEERDFLFANFRNAVNVCPYIVLVDRRCRNILIVIRGTLSFEDMISDVTINPDPLDEVGEEFGFDGIGEFCHRGMLEAAKYVHDDMEARKVLHNAFEDHPEFNLRIMGHSLGAGVAAVLGLMMRKEYPQLRCLCFSPPGCVFTERTAKESKEYIWAYVLHNDIIPRLSYQSLANLRNDVIEMIARIKVPKHKVFAKNMRFRSESNIQDPSKILHERESIPQSAFYSQFSDYMERQKGREKHEVLQVRMICPGKICQLYRTSEKLNNVPCSPIIMCLKCIPATLGLARTQKYTVLWTEAEDLSEICISSSMMSDHFPYNVARALQVAAEAVGVFDIKTTEINSNEDMQEGEKKRS